MVGVTLWLSWEYKIFSLLLLAAVVLSLFIATFFPQRKDISIPIVVTGVALVLGEVAVPFFSIIGREHAHYDKSSSYAAGGYFERVSGVGYRPSAGLHTSKKFTSDGEVIYDVRYTIGVDGYRKDVVSDDFDVYLYGGSFTFGEGLNDNETIPYFLHELYGIKVKNVGVHGYGLNQALFNIEQGVSAPSGNGVNVLLTAPWHALRSSCKPDYSVGTPRYELTPSGVSLTGFCSSGGLVYRIFRESNIFSLAYRGISNKKNEIRDEDIGLYIAIIRRIAELSNSNGIRLIIAYIDATEDQLATTSWTNQSLINELTRISEVVDVTLAERREDLAEKYFIHEHDQHPSKLANKRRAEILYASFLHE